MASLAILRRDLLRYLRNPVRTALLFAVPVVMAAVFALAFGGGSGDQISIKVLLFDEDGTLLSRLADGVSTSTEASRRLDLVQVGEEGYTMMENGEASALVHIPKNFTDDYLEGRPTTIEVVKNPAERFLPRVVEEGVGIGGIVLSVASRVFRSELQQIAQLKRGTSFPADAAVAELSAGFNGTLRGLERYLFPPVIDLESVVLQEDTTETDSGVAGILAYVLPGFSIMGILFLAQSATRDILVDRESGMLRHLLTAPVSPTDLLIGKCLSVFSVTGLGFTVFIVIGLAAGISWGPAPAVIFLMLASSLAAAGLLLLIMSLAGSERQGDTIATIVIMVFSMLGGAFIPVSQIPGFLRPISAATPVYWSSQAFATLMLNGGSLADIVPNVVVLTVVGAAMLLGGAAILGRRIRRGAV
ncbi:MAG: ABC transporter permease [Acidobacteriota bacterium]